MTNREFLEKEVPLLLDKLTPKAKPIWGIMTAQIMVEHLGPTLIAATLPNHVTVSTPADRLKKLRERVLSDEPFHKNIKDSNSPAILPPLRFTNMPTAKTKLLSAIQKFYTHFDQNPTSVTTHKYFGDLSFEQWETFQYKHFQHHFKQFGLIPE